MTEAEKKARWDALVHQYVQAHYQNIEAAIQIIVGHQERIASLEEDVARLKAQLLGEKP